MRFQYSYVILDIFFQILILFYFSWFNRVLFFSKYSVYLMCWPNFRYCWQETINISHHIPQWILFFNEYYDLFYCFNWQFFCWNHSSFSIRSGHPITEVCTRCLLALHWFANIHVCWYLFWECKFYDRFVLFFGFFSPLITRLYNNNFLCMAWNKNYINLHNVT